MKRTAMTRTHFWKYSLGLVRASLFDIFLLVVLSILGGILSLVIRVDRIELAVFLGIYVRWSSGIQLKWWHNETAMEFYLYSSFLLPLYFCLLLFYFTFNYFNNKNSYLYVVLQLYSCSMKRTNSIIVELNIQTHKNSSLLNYGNILLYKYIPSIRMYLLFHIRIKYTSVLWQLRKSCCQFF